MRLQVGLFPVTKKEFLDYFTKTSELKGPEKMVEFFHPV
jgi:hypothetical protein